MQNALKFISIKIIAAISWPPPLIHFFHPGFLRPHSFFLSLALFVWVLMQLSMLSYMSSKEGALCLDTFNRMLTNDMIPFICY